jgi:dipeptidyl aminopeptidase/acylaminoacyl peptidase
LLCAAPAWAKAQAQDGKLIDSVPCELSNVSYEQIIEATHRRVKQEVDAARADGYTIDADREYAARVMTREEYDHWRTSLERTECRRVTYLSDGLKVKGYLWKPRAPAGAKLPLVVFNRGGSRELGKLTPDLPLVVPFLDAGFAVLGSQYRGNDGGEGKDTFGGDDIDDVMNLFALARGLGYVDMDDVFMVGVSRGGMMTLLALARGAPVRAAVVLSAATDLMASSKERPQMKQVYSETMPGFAEHPEETLRARSAVEWPEKINVPLLILHGTADWRTAADTQALALAQKLQKLGKQYQLIMYDGDGHGAYVNHVDRDHRQVEWLQAHRKPPRP